MEPRATIHKILLVLFLLAAWGTSCTSSTQQETAQQQTRQETTRQQETQQETTRQASQTRPSTTQETPEQRESPEQRETPEQAPDLAAQFVGTWEKTSFQGNLVPSGTQVLQFSEDGTLKSSTNDGSEDWTAQYSVLDDSHIRFTFQDGALYVANYSLNGDTLTVTAQDQTGTFQRTG